MPKSCRVSIMRQLGYTFIELLVVISVIAVLSSFVFINYRGASNDELMRKDLSRVQSIYKQAQANATSSTVCLDTSDADSEKEVGNWFVEIDSTAGKIYLKCRVVTAVSNEETLIKTYTINPVFAIRVRCLPGTLLGSVFGMTYQNLSGGGSFWAASSLDLCVKSAKQVQIELYEKANEENVDSFILNLGGSIDAT